MIDKNKMHRAIQIKTGKVKWVSPRLAKNPDMLLDYGMMLQELPEEEVPDFVKPSASGEGNEHEGTSGEAFDVTEEELIESIKDELPEMLENAAKEVVKEEIKNSASKKVIKK